MLKVISFFVVFLPYIGMIIQIERESEIYTDSWSKRSSLAPMILLILCTSVLTTLFTEAMNVSILLSLYFNVIFHSLILAGFLVARNQENFLRYFFLGDRVLRSKHLVRLALGLPSLIMLSGYLIYSVRLFACQREVSNG